MVFKRDDIEPCFVCREGVGANSLMFYRIHVETFVLDAKEIQRQDGLERMMGGNALIAHVIGPDPDFAARLSERTVLVCQACLMRAEMHHLAVTMEETRASLEGNGGEVSSD